MFDIPPGRLVVFADIGCPWAHVAVHRLHETRAAMGLDGRVVFDLHAFPLEVFNGQATPKKVLDAEIPVTGALAPDAGWQMWQRPEHEYPVTMLPALEAVHAAKEQGLKVSEQLDRALRRGFFAASRNVSMRHEILDIAGSVPGLDVDALASALDDGRARSALADDRAVAETDEVNGSPHVFVPGGGSAHNPGIEMHWEGEHGEGFPVVDKDDPRIYERLLAAAARDREETKMDEARLREDADAHGRATVEGDLKTAGSYLDKEAYGAAGQVMEKMPKPLEGSEVGSVELQGDEALVQIRYSGGGDEVVVESRWAERDGNPKIVGLRVL